jgi:predicted metal-dependent hydrolase
MVTDYLIRYQLGPSSIFTMSVLHSTTFPFFNYKCAETLSENHPFIRLRRALNVFNLIIAPADKNRILVIAPNELFQNEINIHLSDGETYLQLTQVKYDQYIRQIIDVVMETMLFYGEPICSYLRLEHLV